jgi:hypothetical protein
MWGSKIDRLGEARGYEIVFFPGKSKTIPSQALIRALIRG